MIIVSGGKFTEIKQSKDTNKVIVQVANVIILQKNGKVRVCGAGEHLLEQYERILQVFDLRKQFAVLTVENIITADLIPLTIELGIGYRIKPASKSELGATSLVVICDGQGLYPVVGETILKAAFNVSGSTWHGFAQGVPVSLLRDFIMGYSIDELFRVHSKESNPLARATNRQVKLIEDEIKQNAEQQAEHVGVEITDIDIRTIFLPDDLRDKFLRQVLSTNHVEAGEHLTSINITQSLQEQTKRGRISTLQKQIVEWNRRLWKLEEQNAAFGNSTPPNILNEIEDCQEKIFKLETEFFNLLDRSAYP